VYFCLTDMAQDAGKSFHDYGLLETTKDVIHQLAAHEGVPYHKYCQILHNEVWAPEPWARHFGKWLGPLYDAMVTLLDIQLHREEEQRLLFATHMEREVQKRQSAQFNGWISQQPGAGGFSPSNDDVLLAKTGRISAAWKEEGVARGLSPQQCSSAPEVISHIDPLLAAELSVMKYFMAHESLSLEQAHRRSHAMRLAFQQDAGTA